MLIKYSTPGLRIQIARSFGAKIGDGCIIYSVNFGTTPFLISIGNHVLIASNVALINHDGAHWVLKKDNQFTGTIFGPIIIRDNCYIGYGSIILPNVEIGPNSIIGAGSIVTKNVPPNMVFAGNPARPISSIDQYLERCNGKDTGRIRLRDEKKMLSNKFKRRLSKEETNGNIKYG